MQFAVKRKGLIIKPIQVVVGGCPLYVCNHLCHRIFHTIYRHKLMYLISVYCKTLELLMTNTVLFIEHVSMCIVFNMVCYMITYS